MTFAGIPAAMQFAGMLFVTSDFAPTTALSPIVTPFSTVTSEPSQTLFPIITGE